MRIIHITWFEKLLNLILGKKVYFYDPRLQPGWVDGDYLVQILKCRPGRRHHHEFVVTLMDTNPELLLVKAKVWCESANKNRID